jgi:hypothetical protein
MDLFGGVVSIFDSLIYTPQEMARDDLAKQQATAAAAAAQAQLETAKAQAANSAQSGQNLMRIGLIALGAVGLAVGGWVIVSSLKK